jgi:hypothetical protein
MGSANDKDSYPGYNQGYGVTQEAALDSLRAYLRFELGTDVDFDHENDVYYFMINKVRHRVLCKQYNKIYKYYIE